MFERGSFKLGNVHELNRPELVAEFEETLSLGPSYTGHIGNVFHGEVTHWNLQAIGHLCAYIASIQKGIVLLRLGRSVHRQILDLQMVLELTACQPNQLQAENANELKWQIQVLFRLPAQS